MKGGGEGGGGGEFMKIEGGNGSMGGCVVVGGEVK